MSANWSRYFFGFKQKRRLSGMGRNQFAIEAAAFLSSLNAIHPFREGNGRTQTLFLALLADQAGHPLDLERLEPEAFLSAMVESFRGNNGALAAQLRELAG